jgi:hypothetical protein
VRTNSDLYAAQTFLSGLVVSILLCGAVLVLRGFRLRR